MDTEVRMYKTQEARPHLLPPSRKKYIRSRQITGPKHYLESNPEAADALKRRKARIAYFIRTYGYIPQADGDIGEPTGGKSGMQFERYLEYDDDPDIKEALEGRNARLEYHVINAGVAYDALKKVPDYLRNTDRKPTRRDYERMYGLMVFGLQTHIAAEKIRALNTPRRKSERIAIKQFGIEGPFAPTYMRLLSNLPYFEVDQDGKPIPPVVINGISPNLKAQSRAGAVRDLIAEAKALSRHDLRVEDLEQIILMLKKNQINLGLKKRLTPHLLQEVLQNYPEQSGTYHILSRRKKIDSLIGKWKQQRGEGPQYRHWHEWYLHHDDVRQTDLEQLMQEAFAGNVYEGVKFDEFVTGKVVYNPEEQYTFSSDFKKLEVDLTPVAHLYVALRAA